MRNGVLTMKVSVPRGIENLVRGRAFVLGQPIQHSLSPLLHQAAYSFLDEPIDYARWETAESDIAHRFGTVPEQLNIRGYSVTMPLKKAVFNYVDRVGDFAQAIGAINTVYWREEKGQPISYGHNTDVAGILNALDWAGAQKSSQVSRAILGGGNTAASALAALRVLGSRQVDMYVRNQVKAQSLIPIADSLDIKLDVFPLENFPCLAAQYATVISTLPAGAADSWVPQLTKVLEGDLLDVSYDPWPSALALQWNELGGSVVSGKDMLLYQAIDQIKLFIGGTPSQKLPHELEMMNAMCDSISIPPRDRLRTWAIDPEASMSSL